MFLKRDAGGNPRPRRQAFRQALRYAAVLPIVAGVTAVAEIFYRVTGSDRLSSIFLAGVLIAAFLLGSGPAYLAALLAFLVYTFQVNPRFQFSFGSPDDFNVLILFLVVSGMVGLLMGRVRDEAGRANSRQRVTKALLDATQEFSASSDESYIRARLLHHVARAVHGDARDVTPGEAVPEGWNVRDLRMGELALGAVAWKSNSRKPLADEARTMLQILVDTGAAAIARSRLAAEKAEAVSRARTEDLRNALLSSISHDLRTPLAAILASSSSLQEFADSFDAATRRDLATTIREEAERLDHFVANLLHMTRLEAGALTIRKSPFNVPEVIRRALSRRCEAAGRETRLTIAPNLPEASGDPLLFEQAVGNVVENAHRYAPRGTLIAVEARLDGDLVRVEVQDEGPGVTDDEIGRLFDKFFRGQAGSETSGTGLGLSITRGLMESMDGGVAAANRTDGTRGLKVTLQLEAAPA
jgi:two-component system sensor histidine kinase KdpD